MTRAAGRPGPAVLAMLTGWVALISWQGMIAEPSGYLLDTLLVGLLVALVGSGLRALGGPTYAVVWVQLLLAAFALNTLFAAGRSLLGLLPTEASVRQVLYAIGNGAATLNTYSAPVEVNTTHTRAVLAACGLLVLLCVDLLAMGLRRPALVALPLLVTLSVPISILDAPMALPVFVVTALLFLRLLVTEHPGPAPGMLWQVSIAAVLVAVLAAPLVPVTDLLDRSDDAVTGAGSGARDFELAAVDPLIRMRRDLVEQTNTPLVYAETEARSTSYLRTTVLDRFTSNDWRPSQPDLSSENTADGVFPRPPGLAPGTGTTKDKWSFELAPGLTTTWLPLPSPIRDLDVAGRWRFDSRTLDVALVGGTVPSGLRYQATSLVPAVSAEALNTAVRAPASLRTSMTEVPEDLPAVITRRAREVTRGAATDYAKAVAIQDWFRQDGGFRYSLEQRSGSGMDLLAAFVTDDRVGYCEQFAAAMAAMGRALGIPSRVAVGFLDGGEEPDGRILYTSDDRHAWPEMYFSGVGWVRFEPTPGQRTGTSPAWTRESTAPEPSASPSVSVDPQTAPTPAPAPADTSTDAGQGVEVPWRPVALVLVVAVLVAAPGLVRRAQRRRRLSADDPAVLAEGAWTELHATALDLGLDWPESHTPRDQARSVAGQVQAGAEDLGALEALLVQVERGRYAPAGVPGPVEAGTRSATVRTVGAWRRMMTDSVGSEPSDSSRWWRRVWPASLLPRRWAGRARGQ